MLFKLIADVWKIVNNNKALIKPTAKLVRIQLLSKKIDKLVKKYKSSRGMPSGIREVVTKVVRKDLKAIELELRTISDPGLPGPLGFSEKGPKLKDLGKELAGLVIESSAGYLAQSELTRIYLLKLGGDLPANPKTWKERRNFFLKQLAEVRPLNTHLRARIQKNELVIEQTHKAADKLRKAQKDPYFSLEQKAMLDLDWERWESKYYHFKDANKYIQAWVTMTDSWIQFLTVVIFVGDFLSNFKNESKTDKEKIMEALGKK